MPKNIHELAPIDVESIHALGDVIRILKTRKFIAEQFYEFQIFVDKNPITPTTLRELTKLPCEVALTESQGKVILNTGGEHGMQIGNYSYEKRRHTSRLSLHTHREYPDDREVSVPSFSDVLDTTFVSKETPLLLVNPTGIMKYHSPTYDPFTHKRFRGDTMELICKYCKGPIELRRQLAEDTKMIEKEISWSDTAGIQKMMDIINLTSQSRSHVTRG